MTTKDQAKARLLAQIAAPDPAPPQAPPNPAGQYTVSRESAFEVLLEPQAIRKLDDGGIRAELSPLAFVLDPATSQRKAPIVAVLALPPDYVRHLQIGRTYRLRLEGV